MLSYREKALADLADIFDFTVAVWGLEQARRYLHALRQQCQAIGMGVVSGRSAGNIQSGLYRHTYGRHIIFFSKSEASIEIIRILLQSMDAKSRLSKP
jgi:toxin ParE1/3/4